MSLDKVERTATLSGSRNVRCMRCKAAPGLHKLMAVSFSGNHGLYCETCINNFAEFTLKEVKNLNTRNLTAYLKVTS